MKLTAETKALRDTLSRLTLLPGSSTGSPVSQVVTFEADMEGVRMTRFSAEAKITINLESVSIEDADGVFVVNHASALRFANQLPAKEVILESDDKHVYFTSGKSKSKIAVTAAPECEPPESEMETEHIRMPVEHLVRALEFVSPRSARTKHRRGFAGYACA